jgi:hypothetical protein
MRRNLLQKKENQIFPIYMEIQSGAVAKSYMRRKVIYEAVSHILLCNCSTLTAVYEENLIYFFFSVAGDGWRGMAGGQHGA